MRLSKYLIAIMLSGLIHSCSEDLSRFDARKAQSGDATAERYSELEIKNILEQMNKDNPNPFITKDIFENGLTNLEIESIMDFATKNGSMTPEELKQLRDSLLEIAAKDANANEDIYDNGKKKQGNPISVVFDSAKIDVTSPNKDLSNVVIEFTDGTRQRFEGLKGHNMQFAGTGENAGKVIARAWIKAGSNHSGDGPGYGEKFEASK